MHTRTLAKQIKALKPGILEMVYPHKRWVLGQLLQGLQQTEVAAELGVSQPTVHYILYTTLKRCSQYNQFRKPSWKEVLAATTKCNSENARVLQAMYRHRQQSAAARSLGRTQGYVRHRFLLGLQELENKRVFDWLALETYIEPRFEHVQSLWKGKTKRCPSAETLIKLAREVANGGRKP